MIYVVTDLNDCWLRQVVLLFFCREKREQELEFFLKKKYNRLGGRFDTKVNSLNNLKTDPGLVLK